MRKICGVVSVVAAVSMLVSASSAEPLPSRLQGTWRITRVLPTSNTACWDKDKATPLVGSRLTYLPGRMRWQGGEIQLTDVATRTVTAAEFRSENPGEDGSGASFAQLGIRSGSVIEVDMQHEDADITGATTEVPGDSVLIAGPGRIVVSACGVYFEATRTGAIERAANLHR